MREGDAVLPRGGDPSFLLIGGDPGEVHGDCGPETISNVSCGEPVAGV